MRLLFDREQQRTMLPLQYGRTGRLSSFTVSVLLYTSWFDGLIWIISWIREEVDPCRNDKSVAQFKGRLFSIGPSPGSSLTWHQVETCQPGTIEEGFAGNVVECWWDFNLFKYGAAPEGFHMYGL